MQADQAGPAIGCQQLYQALLAPQFVVMRERGVRLYYRPGVLRIISAATEQHRGNQGRAPQYVSHQRPRRNQRSISAKEKRAQVGRP